MFDVVDGLIKREKVWCRLIGVIVHEIGVIVADLTCDEADM